MGERVYKYGHRTINFETEWVEDYEPGGLYPVDLGSIIDGRFEVVYKLGYGGIATAWLCYERPANKWRALKINAASHSGKDCPDAKVIEIMRKQGVENNQLEQNHIAFPLETLWLDSPNGSHLCSVLPVLGPKLSDWRRAVPGLPMPAIKGLCYQIVRAMDFLHSKGICHGDFRPQNILMQLHSGVLERIGPDEMRHILGEPEMAEITAFSSDDKVHAPKYLVENLEWERFTAFISHDIAVVDFGEAYEACGSERKLGIPWEYAAPEVVFEGQPGPGTDIWSLAVTLLQTVKESGLINSEPEFWEYARSIEQLFGPIPDPHRSVLERIDYEEKLERDRAEDARRGREVQEVEQRRIDWEVYEETESLVRKKKPVWKFFTIPCEDVLQLADLLMSCFQYNSEDRVCARDLLTHQCPELPRTDTWELVS
ncbi:kinase-like protein [Xylariaceae sp. FL0804]|nr:kinase-like protein [Xylariaceae sp. FL0804]